MRWDHPWEARWGLLDRQGPTEGPWAFHLEGFEGRLRGEWCQEHPAASQEKEGHLYSRDSRAQSRKEVPGNLQAA